MKSKGAYIEVAPAIPLPAGKRQTFTYHVPDSSTLLPHTIVNIPFGKRFIEGVALSLSSKKPSFPTKSATVSLKDAVLTDGQVVFARWIAETMQGGLGYTLRLFLPPRGSVYSSSSISPLSKKKISSFVKTIARSKTPAVFSLFQKDTVKRHIAIAHLAYQAVKEDKQIVIILPEISLLEPLHEVCKKYISDDRLAVLHANKKNQDLRRAWYGVKDGTINVVIGTQKALFLPWRNLSVVVIEQEYIPTHKLWDQYPRLHGVFAGKQLALIHAAHVVLSGSFPSLFARHLESEKNIVSLIDEPLHPTSHIILPTFEDRQQRRLLPLEIVKRIQQYLKNKERIFILCNKRGAWQVALCRVCHAPGRCPTCKSPMLVEKVSSKKKKKEYLLQCKQCNVHIDPKTPCQTCHKGKLQFIRPGVETIESLLRELFSGTRIQRVDAGVGRKEKQAMNSLLSSEGSIIVGTNAALTHISPHACDRVMWLFPEDTLLYPDIRSQERGWYLLARLAEMQKKKHPITIVSRHQDVVSDVFAQTEDVVFEKELRIRKRLAYPPYTDMVKLTFSSSKQETAKKRAEGVRNIMQKQADKESIIIRGPYISSVSMKGLYSAHLLLLGPLSRLTPMYSSVSADEADYMPERIL